jgi:hypothetical protein
MIIDNKALKVFGISAKIAAGLIIGGVIFAAYRHYFELRRTKLQIEVLKKELEKK